MPHTSRRKSHSGRFSFQRSARKLPSPHTQSSGEKEYTLSMEIDANSRSSEELENNVASRLDLLALKDLFTLCQEKCGARPLSSLIYMIMRYANCSWRSIDELFQEIGAQRCEASHKWSAIFLSGDLDQFLNDGRGGKRQESLYDIFPELESEGRAFAIARCAEKSAGFKVSDLANFIDQRFYEITGTNKIYDQLIRSEESCRLDIRRWGGLFETNSQRPYFHGHERPDVVEHRAKFTSYFIGRMDHYYAVSSGDQPTWHQPSKKPCVVLCA